MCTYHMTWLDREGLRCLRGLLFYKGKRVEERRETWCWEEVLRATSLRTVGTGAPPGPSSPLPHSRCKLTQASQLIVPCLFTEWHRIILTSFWIQVTTKALHIGVVSKLNSGKPTVVINRAEAKWCHALVSVDSDCQNDPLDSFSSSYNTCNNLDLPFLGNAH